MHRLRRDAAAQAGRLLCILFLRNGALSTGSGGTFGGHAILLYELSGPPGPAGQHAATSTAVYREHSMATNSSHDAPLQPLPPAVGIAPVISSRSTLWNDSALSNSCDRQ